MAKVSITNKRLVKRMVISLYCQASMIKCWPSICSNHNITQCVRLTFCRMNLLLQTEFSPTFMKLELHFIITLTFYSFLSKR